MRTLFFLPILLFFTHALSAQTPSDDYGYSEADPIKVGTENINDGPTNQRAYLDLLTGPNGEDISYERLGSCCEFETENSPFGGGLLDRYEIEYEGLEQPIVLYLNMYDPDPDGIAQAPKGLKLKEN